MLRVAVLLAFFVALPFRHPQADTDTLFGTPPIVSGKQPFIDTPQAAAARNEQIGLLLDYVRRQWPSWLPGLPAALRPSPGWAENDAGDDWVKFNVYPLYGRDELGSQNFWGPELAFNLGPDAPDSLGKIVMRYDSGTPNLADINERGFEIGVQPSLDKNLILDAGMGQNSTTQLGNYVLLRWKIASFGQ